MKPLFVLLGVFFIVFFLLRVTNGWWDYRLSARIAMAAMLLLTAIAHFAFTRGMEMMLPDFVPFKKAMVYLTGIAELAGAVGLLLNAWFALAGVMLTLLFMLMLPANIHAALKRINYEKGTLDGKGPGYLWFRVPLQLFFIAWIYFLILY
ncbi:hypothetical protein Q4E93_12300 [Flavitalea sp. BT771]|uniref:DoxX family protein n=1 Tax=Flavitalea sp. BT771 TaxID=3063329 RepID=UPI0026E2E968|nr:hypothetical protein [Flavitalea sp. BT771]MDO6431376.1 hypothetical protein [Flavitalea sp. BT771]MDV6220284.1 hypothetical protein [Flavitalea sp. BT771]